MGKINKSGRSKHEGGYIKLSHYIFDCFAWSQLSPNARCAWLEFVRVYNGSNNGRLGMPVRKLADRLHASRGTAANTIQELLTYGFIDLMRASTFVQKRLASEYRLSHLPCNITGKLPSKNFVRTAPGAKEAAE